MSTNGNDNSINYNPATLIALRAIRGLKQSDLAELVGCTQPLLSALEHGKVPMTDHARASIAQALAVPPAALDASISSLTMTGPHMIIYLGDAEAFREKSEKA